MTCCGERCCSVGHVIMSTFRYCVIELLAFSISTGYCFNLYGYEDTFKGHCSDILLMAINYPFLFFNYKTALISKMEYRTHAVMFFVDKSK